MPPTLTTAYTNAGTVNIDMSPAAASQAYGNAKSVLQINGMDSAAAFQDQQSNPADQQAYADSANVDMSPAASQDQLTVGNAQSSQHMASTTASQDKHTYPETIPSSDKKSNLTPLSSDNGDNGPGVDIDDVGIDDKQPSEDNGDDGPGVDAEDADAEDDSKFFKHWHWGSLNLFSLDLPLPDFGSLSASCVIKLQPPEVTLTDEGLLDEFDDDSGVGTDEKEYEKQGDEQQLADDLKRDSKKKNGMKEKKKGKERPMKGKGKTPNKKIALYWQKWRCH
ncbi:hypothetical protein H2248_001661 [Termitomyces sp. 'cryptogamus']|nr:hypothetical protein H2248_001661 [Termitomyces sp. 'cryptogamus']